MAIRYRCPRCRYAHTETVPAEMLRQDWPIRYCPNRCRNKLTGITVLDAKRLGR